MKRKGLFSKVSVTMALLFTFLTGYSYANPYDAVKPGWKSEKAARGWIQSKIQHMTLEEKIGQLFMVHVYGKTAEDANYELKNIEMKRGGKNFKEVIEKYHIGGVIYFNWTDNIGTPLDSAQVNKLSNDIQKIAMSQRMEIPLLISTDQEGGIVARVTEPATVFPGNMAVGATRSLEYSKKVGQIMGKELKALGINMNLAPTLDVNINSENPVIGVRSFSENPDIVSEFGVAQIKGYQNQNVVASAKHFPGHGDTNVDSHYGLPIINHDLKTLEEVDLKPFKAAIDAGIDSIMTAHIVVPALDNSGLPATLSKPILTDLLRNKLNYDGIIITDSLGMSGANVFPPERIPVEAVKAGVDILLNPPDVEVAYNGLLNAVKSGEISEKRIDESVFRIMMVKMKRGIFENPYAEEASIKEIGSRESLEVAEEITNKSITLIKNENGVLPLKKDNKVLVVGPSSANPVLLSSLLKEKGIDSSEYSTGTTPTTAQINGAVAKAQGYETVVVTTYNANTNSGQKALVNALVGAGKKVVIMSMRNPYDIGTFPNASAGLAAYGNRPISTRAAARALTGEINPSGKLPVTIPGAFEFGTGLSY